MIYFNLLYSRVVFCSMERGKDYQLPNQQRLKRDENETIPSA